MTMRPRVLYFAVFTYFSFSGGRFTATFLEHELGLENWMISTAMVVQTLISILCSSWLGGLADSWEASCKGGKNHGRLQIMSLGLLLSTTATLLHSLGSVYLQWSMRSETQQIMDDVVDTETSESGDSQPTIPLPLLVYHLILRSLFAMSNCAIMPALDGLTLATLTDTHEYGKERLYGAISWAIAHLTFGPLIDLCGFSVLYATIVISCIGCLITFRIFANSSLTNQHVGVGEQVDGSDLREPLENESKASLGKAKKGSTYQSLSSSEYVAQIDRDEEKKTPEMETPPQTGSNDVREKSFEKNDAYFENDTTSNAKTESVEERLSFTDLVGLLFEKAPLNISFIVSLFALFIGMSVVEKLIFLYFEFLGGSNTMCAVTVVVTVLFEIPLFHYAPDVLRSLGSPRLLQWACVAYVVRVIGYSFIPTSHPYLVLFLEPLHGITIAFATTSSVAFADEWAPTGYEASGQGFMSTIRNLGMFVGLCIGGFLEGRTLYRVLAVIVTTGGLILATGNYLATKPRTRTEEDQPLLQQPQKQGSEQVEII